MARLDVRNIPEQLREAVLREANRQGVPYAEIVREAIAFYMGWLEGQRKEPPPEE